MSFAEIKKSVNSDLNTPLNTIINTRASQASVNNVQTTVNGMTGIVNNLQGTSNLIAEQGIYKTLRQHQIVIASGKASVKFSGPGIFYSIGGLNPNNRYSGYVYVNDVQLLEIDPIDDSRRWFPPFPIYFIGNNALRIEIVNQTSNNDVVNAFIFN